MCYLLALVHGSRLWHFFAREGSFQATPAVHRSTLFFLVDQPGQALTYDQPFLLFAVGGVAVWFGRVTQQGPLKLDSLEAALCSP